MPANKNALIRYKTIDNCLRNRYRRWTLQDLVDACSEVLYEMEGIDNGVSVRTIQGDIQMMRSDKLGYNAPIEVYERKYYRYSNPDYSITEMPMSQNDYEVMQDYIQHRQPRKVMFWASAEQSKYIATKPLHRTQRQIGHNPDDGSCLFEIEVVINYEMYSIFLSLGSGVRVLQPPTAVEYMRTKTEEMAKLYR